MLFHQKLRHHMDIKLNKALEERYLQIVANQQQKKVKEIRRQAVLFGNETKTEPRWSPTQGNTNNNAASSPKTGGASTPLSGGVGGNGEPPNFKDYVNSLEWSSRSTEDGDGGRGDDDETVNTNGGGGNGVEGGGSNQSSPQPLSSTSSLSGAGQRPVHDDLSPGSTSATVPPHPPTTETVLVSRVDGVDTDTGTPTCHYKCHLCGAGTTFRLLIELQRHLSLHVDSFPCAECDSAYDSKSSLDQHVTLQHTPKNTTSAAASATSGVTNVSPPISTITTTSTPSTTPTSEGNQYSGIFYKKVAGLYMCRYCNKGFERLFCLHRHERIHTGYKPCHCPHCGLGFTESGSLRAHVASEHAAQLDDTAAQHLSPPHPSSPSPPHDPMTLPPSPPPAHSQPSPTAPEIQAAPAVRSLIDHHAIKATKRKLTLYDTNGGNNGTEGPPAKSPSPEPGEVTTTAASPHFPVHQGNNSYPGGFSPLSVSTLLSPTASVPAYSPLISPHAAFFAAGLTSPLLGGYMAAAAAAGFPPPPPPHLAAHLQQYAGTGSQQQTSPPTPPPTTPRTPSSTYSKEELQEQQQKQQQLQQQLSDNNNSRHSSQLQDDEDEDDDSKATSLSRTHSRYDYQVVKRIISTAKLCMLFKNE